MCTCNRDLNANANAKMATAEGDTQNIQVSEAEYYECGSCKGSVNDDEDAILCEICNIWHHIECEGVSRKVYKFLTQEGSSVHWYCKKCNVTFTKVLGAISKLESRQDMTEQQVQELDRRTKMAEDSIEINKSNIANIHQTVESLVDKMSNQETVESKFDETAASLPKEEVVKVIRNELKLSERENNEQEVRRRNIMVFELPESDGGSAQERSNEDTKEFIRICTELLEVAVTKHDISQSIRIGKKEEGKIRPLRLKLTTEQKKKEIFMNLNKLRGITSEEVKYKIDHDLTKTQRLERKELVNKAKSLKDDDVSKKFNFLVRGPPWGMYIKKVKANPDVKKATRE